MNQIEKEIHDKRSKLFLMNEKVYIATAFHNGKKELLAFKLFHLIHNWTDFPIPVNNNFTGVLLPKNNEIVLYYYLKQLQ